MNPTETPPATKPAATRAGRAAVVAAVVAAAGEVVLANQTTPAWSPAGPVAFLLAFLVGPLAFLALVAWRRRAHPSRSRLLLAVAVLVGGVGLAILGNDYARFVGEEPERRVRHANPVMLPLYQWGVVLLAWVALVLVEGREKPLTGEPGERRA